MRNDFHPQLAGNEPIQRNAPTLDRSSLASAHTPCRVQAVAKAGVGLSPVERSSRRAH